MGGRSIAAALLAAGVVLAATGAATAAPLLSLPQRCAAKLAEVGEALDLSPRYRAGESLLAACERGGNDPVAAATVYLRAVVHADQTERKPAAPNPVAQKCLVTVGRVAAILGLDARTANTMAFHNACARGKGRPTLAARNLLTSYGRSAPRR